MLTRLTQSQIIDAFGNPFPYVQADGSISREWEARILVTIPLPAPLPLSWNAAQSTRATKVHRLVAPALAAALTELHSSPARWATINDWGGCYMFRPNRRNPKALSTHSWGLGPDMDVNDNFQGSVPRVDPDTVAIMERHGFLWGGTFRGAAVDGMHWEASLEQLR